MAMGQCQRATRLIVILELLQHLVHVFCVFILQSKRTSQGGGVEDGASLYGCKHTAYMGECVCYREEGPLGRRRGMGRGPATHQQVEGAVPT